MQLQRDTVVCERFLSDSNKAPLQYTTETYWETYKNYHRQYYNIIVHPCCAIIPTVTFCGDPKTSACFGDIIW